MSAARLCSLGARTSDPAKRESEAAVEGSRHCVRYHAATRHFNVTVGTAMLTSATKAVVSAPPFAPRRVSFILSKDDRSRNAGAGGRSRRIATVRPIPCRLKAFQRCRPCLEVLRLFLLPGQPLLQRHEPKQLLRFNREAMRELKVALERRGLLGPFDPSDLIAMEITHLRELLLGEMPFDPQSPNLSAEQNQCTKRDRPKPHLLTAVFWLIAECFFLPEMPWRSSL